MAGDVPSSVATGKYVRQIVVTAPGPQGPGGTNGLQAGEIADLVSYTHNQSAAASTWNIVHNLNFFPNVAVFDSADTQVEGAVIHNDATSLSITFSAAISGKAHLS